ncbi:hypothetical protein [Magnetospira sp. QH-2]|uniref:hypothetical protein n=1 Tax=Magnetospira sp. (strain QH-2) TaxID=1288970 RepID=UPI0003E817D0|nr:hypothetical protein [Magnetospira sp. QH-2]CCQ74570.1 conserved exported protein of unknown function [Magnetospira sp. QH-2]
MRKYLSGLVAGCALLTLAACGDPSKQEIVDKARSADTRQQLESILGKPDELSKMGPIEQWTYNAADGTVTFTITGDTVALQTTGESQKK